MRRFAWAGYWLASIPLTFSVAGGAAMAQDADDTIFLSDEIVVYGAPNASTAEDSNASVGIADAAAIENYHLGSVEEAFQVMGNVTESGSNESGFIIRGVNSEGLAPGGTAPLATLYIDGVQQTANGARRGARGAWDVEQIEVYRGPQSTLQGRAALAGAIHMKTKDPSYENEAEAATEVGSGGHYWGGAMVNMPLVDNQFALRLSAEYETNDSDVSYPLFRSAKNYDEYITDEYFQLRGKLLIEPEALPDTRAVLTYSYAHDAPTYNTIGGPGQTNIAGFPAAPITSFDQDRGDFNYPFYQYVENRSADNHNAGLELTHDVDAELRLTSLTTFSKNITDRGSINDGAAFDETAYVNGVLFFGGTGSCDGLGDLSCLEAASVKGEQDFQIFVQELRANYDNGPMRAVVGLYASKEDSKLSRHANGDLSNGFPEEFRSDNTSDTMNLAAFGEVNYELIPSWRIIVGGRADYTDREDVGTTYTRNLVVNVVTDPGTTTTTSSEEFVFLPKLGLVKEFNEDHSLAFIYQHGYRVGGAGISTQGDRFDFDPEFTTNFELAYKGLFADGAFRLGANAFYQDWKDQQVEIDLDPTPGINTVVDNAAESNSYGFELEASWLATDDLTLFASLGYVESEFVEYVDSNGVDHAGSAFPRAPRWNVGFGGAYHDPSGFFAAANATYSNDRLSRIGGDDTDSRTIVNAQTGYKFENFSIAAYAENAFDERYFTTVSGNAFAGLGEAAEYGVRLGAKY